MFVFLFVNMFLLIFQKRKGRERKKEKHWLPPESSLLRIETMTLASVLIRNQNSNLLVQGMTLNH